MRWEGHDISDYRKGFKIWKNAITYKVKRDDVRGKVFACIQWTPT